MTVYAWARSGRFPELPAPEARLFQVTPDTQVLAHCYWQPDRATRPTLVALHGLEGSSDAHYMRGPRGQGVAARLERGAAQPAQLRRHRASDARALPLRPDRRSARCIASSRDRDGLTRIGVVGYSLGGNLTIKLAGELADWPDSPVRAVVAVSPTIDLERCVRAIERRVEHSVSVELRAQPAGAHAAQGRSAGRARSIWRRSARIWTIRRFDDVYTAPHHGFGGATDYYHRASAMRVVPDIRIPALILAAEDDPFVPADQFADGVLAAIRTSPCASNATAATAASSPTRQRRRRYWAETTASSSWTIVSERFSAARQLIAATEQAARRSRSLDETRCANSGPLPSSSCLKYTNTSSQSAARSAD